MDEGGREGGWADSKQTMHKAHATHTQLTHKSRKIIDNTVTTPKIDTLTQNLSKGGCKLRREGVRFEGLGLVGPPDLKPG